MNNHKQEWSDWLLLNKKIGHEGSAVYKIRLITKGLKPFTLPRLFKKDPSGVVCIGQTTNMEHRRGQAYGAISKGYGHSSMNLVFFLDKYCHFKKRFRGCQFQFKFSGCKNKSDSEKQEEYLSRAYFKEFGEVPPLNSILPNREKNWD